MSDAVGIVGVAKLGVMKFADKVLSGRLEHRALLFDASASMLIEKGPINACF